MPRKTYYDILGVPTGASIDHIKDSYRLLTRKTLITDVAYRTLTTPEKRREYDVWLVDEFNPETQPVIEGEGDEQTWGKRGRERCSCGSILEPEDEWLCQKCWGMLDYYVVFDMFGGHIIHDSQMPLITEPDGQTYWQVPYDGPLFGPFTKEDAAAFLEEKNRARKIGRIGR